MNNKVILFDWGGVVETSHLDYKTMRDIMFSLGFRNLDTEEIREKFHATPCASIFDTITDEEENNEAYKKYLSLFSGDIDVTDEVLNDYKRLYKELMINNPFYKEVSDYIYSLRNRCEIGILSNVQMLDKFRQNSHFNYGVLNHRYLSCELGMAKPNRDIYEYVNNDLKGKEILFLDDNPANIIIPEELGWNVYNVKKGGDIEGIKKACEEFLKE